MAAKGNLGEVVTTCERSLVQASPWGFPSGAKKEWGLSPKLKVRVLHTAQLDVTYGFAVKQLCNRKWIPHEPKYSASVLKGWSCVVSKTNGPEAGKTYFECGEGCICLIDETNTAKVVCA
nr:aquaporin NIP1-1-like [Tanacetum cinerariifolium]